MGLFRGLNLTTLLIRAFVVLLAISVHETAHGYAAYLLGDSTARTDGRLSLNPLRHLDPFGAVCLLLFGFGWAKPVMVNSYHFKKPKRDMALTALAGPLSNILLAFIALLIYNIISHFFTPNNTIILIFYVAVMLNINLAVFNLIPIPPLDGSKIFLPLLPDRLYYDIMRYEQFGFIILIIALYLNVLNPILSTVGGAIYSALTFLSNAVLFFL